MKDRIALHAEPRKVAVVFLSFTLVSLIISILFLFSINRECIQLNSLLHSDYEYSVKADNPMYKNDYYFFNAGIDFTLSDDSPKLLRDRIVSATILYVSMNLFFAFISCFPRVGSRRAAR